MNKNILIKTNLNRTYSSAKLQEKRGERNKWIIFGFITLGFLVNLIWFIKINISIDNLITQRQDTITQLIEDTNKLQQNGQINISKLDIENLYKIESHRIKWADKLKELAIITPEDMAITGLEFRNEKLIINAISLINESEKEFSIVENLIKTLQENEIIAKDFSSIRFKKSQRKITRGQEILVFVIEAKLMRKG